LLRLTWSLRRTFCRRTKFADYRIRVGCNAAEALGKVVPGGRTCSGGPDYRMRVWLKAGPYLGGLRDNLKPGPRFSRRAGGPNNFLFRRRPH